MVYAPQLDLSSAKWTFTTRRVRQDDVAMLDRDVSQAVSGDLVLGRIEKIGSHKRLQTTTGRHSALYVGDLIVAACGDRYATDQLEGIAQIDPDGASLLAGGGVLGRLRHLNSGVAAPTRVAPLGRLLDRDRRQINLDRYGITAARLTAPISVVVVVGSAMNAGKTTAAASLVHGLVRSGIRTAAIKATGTGACGDFNAYLDAGAHSVADMTDVGLASTYRQPMERIVAGLDTLLADAARTCTIAVVEIADGLLQHETAALLTNLQSRGLTDAVVLAAPDAMSLANGHTYLAGKGLRPRVLTGAISRSPLAMAEAKATLSQSVTPSSELADPSWAASFAASLAGGSQDGLAA